MPELRIRRMPVLAQDCSIRNADAAILTASVGVPWEELADGPIGHRVQVVDYDATTNTMYAPAGIDAAAPAGDAEVLGDPAFHARNAYALVMRTLGRFEYALGRRVSWGFRAHQLKVVPHAFEQMNSFYSRDAEALVFGYYRRDDGVVFMCLSHDIVVHEAAHALLDGLRSRFMAPSSPDQAAFHEGFADIVALLSVFSLSEVVERLITHTLPADLPPGVVPRDAITPERLEETALFGLADEMADESGSGRANALRRSVKLKPDPRIGERIQYQEAHRRGEIIVAATMHAFIDAWARRLEDPAPSRTDFVELRRVVQEGADVASTLLTMAIRALDYTPPVHLEFGDFLSAMITADTEIRADDSRYGLRAGLLDWYGRYGIAPAARTASGSWEPADVKLSTEGVRFGSLQSDPVEMFRLIWSNLDDLKLTRNAYSRIASLRPCVRTSPEDGLPLRETVAEYLQYEKVRASELALYGLRKPDGMADATEIELEGGSTLILDDYGQLKYEVHNRLPSLDHAEELEEAQRRLDHLWAQGHFEPGASFAVRLATMHRLRAGEITYQRDEIW